MRAVLLAGALVVLGCGGPPAPDVEVCRDYVHRICIPDICPGVVPLIPIGAECETTLLAKSGCNVDTFTFTTPTRDRFLSCRVALLRAGENPQTHPSCDDVAESFDRCPDVVRMLEGLK